MLKESTWGPDGDKSAPRAKRAQVTFLPATPQVVYLAYIFKLSKGGQIFFAGARLSCLSIMGELNTLLSFPLVRNLI